MTVMMVMTVMTVMMQSGLSRHQQLSNQEQLRCQQQSNRALLARTATADGHSRRCRMSAMTL